MSKGFGKIVIVSTILAGAAVGAYSYFKKNNTEAENANNDSDSSSDFVSDIHVKERNYVDLASTKLEKPIAEAKEAMFEAKDIVSGAWSEAKGAMSEVAKDVKEVVTGAAKDIKEVVKEAKANAEENADEEVVDIIDETADACDACEKAEDNFEEGLNAEKIVESPAHILGSESSEEFFNDEDSEN